jgi:hypothetical protein
MRGEDDFGMYRTFRESPSSGLTSPDESSSTDVSPGRGLPEGHEYDRPGLEYDRPGLVYALRQCEIDLREEIWQLS